MYPFRVFFNRGRTNFYIQLIDNENQYQYNDQWKRERGGGETMYVQLRTITVRKGHADKVVERFGKEGAIEQSEGFVDLSVLVKRNRNAEEDEVVVMVRWESEEACDKWRRSEAHIAGHRERKGKPAPEYIIGADHAAYDVKAIKLPRAAANGEGGGELG
jgi:heme oxygenase (staphylobilin-producing)